MELKRKMQDYYNAIDEKFLDQFGFRIKETSFTKIVRYLHQPQDSSSLAVTRILFGLAMLFDIPSERGGSIMDRRWSGKLCQFPLFPFIRAIPMPYMGIVYAALWLGALGIMLGYKYRIASVTFTVCYWYLFLIEKSYWNNHSYLFGLVAFLLSFTEANCYWSLDVYFEPSKEKKVIPYWNYFLLKYQFLILYFMAGMKKGTVEWLSGYSVMELSQHWVFDPFKLFLTVPQIDYLIVHWFIFLFDLTVAMWMMWARTRNVAMVFCAMFHLMNSRLFTIGLFPWVCLATMPLFYPFDWPKTVKREIKETFLIIKELIHNYTTSFDYCLNFTSETEEETHFENFDDKVDGNEKFTNNGLKNIKNNNGQQNIRDTNAEIQKENAENIEAEIQKEKRENIKDEVQKENTETKDTKTEILKGKTEMEYVDATASNTENNKSLLEKPNKTDDTSIGTNKTSGREKLTTSLIFVYAFIQAFLPYSHFITKGYNNWTNGLYGYSWDMMVHTWHTESVIIRIVDNENNEEIFVDPYVSVPSDRWASHGDMAYQYAHCLHSKLLNTKLEGPKISENLSIYFDVWISLNRRFTQRMFDPNADLLQATWSPFQSVSFLIPLLDEASHWRSTLLELVDEVYSWSEKSDVIFFANLPNHEHEKYILEELSNVSLTVLEGQIAVEEESDSTHLAQSYKLASGQRTAVKSNSINKVITIGATPAFYMYTFVNSTKDVKDDLSHNPVVKPKLPIFAELYKRFQEMALFTSLMGKSMFQIFYGCNGEC